MRISSLSKIIKPSDKKLFKSVKKFEKTPLAVQAESPESTQSTVNSPPTTNGGTRFLEEPRPVLPTDLVARAERRAEEIVNEAEKQAEQIRRRAREESRAEGLENAKKEIDEQSCASALLLDSLMTQMKTQEAELMRLLTPRLANLATELAEKILHREIEKDSSVVARQAEEAISRIVGREKLIIRTNPADEGVMKQHKSVLLKMFDGIDKVEIIADPKVQRGGCIVETDLIRVDAQPSSQLEAARKTLLGEAEK
jgi:flagellar biosynthesis/type III secretory pathway protein FliH